MLLDSVEALDATGIAVLIDYFAEFSRNLYVTLLPEDAAALYGHFPVVNAAELQ